MTTERVGESAQRALRGGTVFGAPPTMSHHIWALMTHKMEMNQQQLCWHLKCNSEAGLGWTSRAATAVRVGQAGSIGGAFSCWRQITSTSPSAQHFCYDFDILTARNTNGNGFHNLGVANPVGPASESLFCSFTAWWNPQNDFTPRDCGLKSLPKKLYDKWHPRHKLRRLLKFWVWRSIKHSLECLLMNASR